MGITALGCAFMPMSMLVMLGFIGTILIDSTFTTSGFFYYGRFVPVVVLAMRGSVAAIIRVPAKQVDVSFIVLWLPLVLFSFISTAYSTSAQTTFMRALSFLAVIVGYSMFFTLPSPGNRNWPKGLIGLTAIIGLTVICGFLFAMTGAAEAFLYSGYENLRGILRNPNATGILSMQAFFLFIYWTGRERRAFQRSLLLIGMLLTIFSILLSGSRASMLGLIVGIVTFLIVNKGIFLSGMSRRARVLTLIAGGIPLLFFWEYILRLVRFSDSGRFFIWGQAWEVIKEAPMIGHGFGGSEAAFFQKIREFGLMMTSPESSYVKLLMDLGIIGLVVAILTLGSIYIRGYRKINRGADRFTTAVLMGFVSACLVNALFESWLFSFGNSMTLPFWFVLAMLWHFSVGGKIPGDVDTESDVNDEVLFLNPWVRPSGPDMYLYTTLKTIPSLASRSRVILANGGETATAYENIGVKVEIWPEARQVRAVLNVANLMRFLVIHTYGIARCLWRLRGNRPGIIVSNTEQMWLGAILARILRIPHVQIFHALTFSYRLSGRPWLMKMYLSVLTLWGGHIVAVSDAVNRELKSGGIPADRITTVYNPIDEQTAGDAALPVNLNDRINRASHIITSTGRLAYLKGQDLLMEALPKVKERFPRILCIFVGTQGAMTHLDRTDDLMKNLQKMVIDSGLDENVLFLDDVPNLSGLLKKSDLYVQPSRSESFGRVIAEALLMGTPAVVFDSGGMAEVLGPGGIAVNPGDTGALADAMISLLSSETERDHLASLGREHVLSNYSASKVSDMFQEVLESLIKT